MHVDRYITKILVIHLRCTSTVRYATHFTIFMDHLFATHSLFTIQFYSWRSRKAEPLTLFSFEKKRKEYYILCFAEIFAISYVYRLLIVAKHKRRTRFSRPRKIVSSSFFPLRIVDHYDGKMRVLLLFFCIISKYTNS